MTDTKAKKIGEWQEDIDAGSWHFEDEEISTYVSFWQHVDKNDAYIACIRWKYPKNSEDHYATYIKIQAENYDIESLLLHVGEYITKWLAEEKKKLDSQD